MTQPVSSTSSQLNGTSALPWAIAVGAVTFALGAGGMFFYTQSQQTAQNDALQALTMQVIGMQQQATVTRAAPTQILTVPDTAETSVAVTVSTPLADAVEPVSTIETVNASGIATTTVQAVDASDANTADLEDRIAQARGLAAQVKLNRLAEGTVADLLTEGVVAGAYSVDAQVDNGQSAGVALVPEGLNNTAGILAELIATSVNAGEIQVPDYIPRDDLGNVDSQTLLFDLVQRSLENGTPEEVAAAAELRRRTIDAFSTTLETEATAPIVEVTTAGDRYYVVEAGDNLAYISLQFYGSTGAYNRIFEANRSIIASPDRIQVGQRLLIPNV